jgi:hypothetical protein
MAIFLQAKPGNTKQARLPTVEAIDAAVDRFGCAPVALAAGPALRYLPLVQR